MPQKMPAIDGWGFACIKQKGAWPGSLFSTAKNVTVRYYGVLNLAAGSEQRKKKNWEAGSSDSPILTQKISFWRNSV